MYTSNDNNNLASHPLFSLVELMTYRYAIKHWRFLWILYHTRTNQMWEHTYHKTTYTNQ